MLQSFYRGVTMKNRQLRNFLFILYPDNESHLQAINKLIDLPNSLLIKHIAKDKTKEHYHCILYNDSPQWTSTICNSLGLGEQDYHFFRSIRDEEFKRFKTIDDYIIYLTHIFEADKDDKYDINDFVGGRVDHAAEVLKSVDKSKYELFLDLALFIREYNLDNLMDTRTFTFTDWYQVCCKAGYGKLFYDNWYKVRDILKPYLNF